MSESESEFSSQNNDGKGLLKIDLLNGRIGRAQWWFRSVSVVIGIPVLIIILLFSGIWDIEEAGPSGFQSGLAFFGLLALVCLILISVKRFHDLNWPGAASLVIPLFWGFTIKTFYDGGEPTYSAVTLMAATAYIFRKLAYKKGTTGPNKFGPDPLNTTDISVNAEEE